MRLYAEIEFYMHVLAAFFRSQRRELASWRDGYRQSLSCISGYGLARHFDVPYSQVVIRESILDSTGCQHLLAEVVLVVADRSRPRLDSLVLANQNFLGDTVEQSRDELVSFGKSGTDTGIL